MTSSVIPPGSADHSPEAGPEIVVLGNLIVDDLVYDDGRTLMAQAGGAVVHYAIGARLWGRSVGIVSLVGTDYPGEILDRLIANGVDLGGVRRLKRPGMRTWLLYEGTRRRVVHRLSSPSHEDASPAIGDIPPSWSPAVIHLAPMPLARQREWLRHLRPSTPATLTVDPFALIDEANWDDRMAAFAGADVLLASEDEVLLDPLVDHRDRWFTSGIPLVLIKQAAAGGVIHDCRRTRVHRWEGRAASVVDATGAGDAFAGGLAAGFVAGEPVGEAVKKAVVSASFALECADVQAFLDVTPDQAQARLADWYR